MLLITNPEKLYLVLQRWSGRALRLGFGRQHSYHSASASVRWLQPCWPGSAPPGPSCTWPCLCLSSSVCRSSCRRPSAPRNLSLTIFAAFLRKSHCFCLPFKLDPRVSPLVAVKEEAGRSGALPEQQPQRWTFSGPGNVANTLIPAAEHVHWLK